MLPDPVLALAEKLRLLPGIGQKSSQKMAIDILQLKVEDFENLITSLQETRLKTGFCSVCGFFCENKLCDICANKNRNHNQICLVEKPTEVLSLEKAENYTGTYHVLNRLISPLDNLFAEDTSLSVLLDQRIPELVKSNQNVELILFLKPSFAAEATTAYLRESINNHGWSDLVKITRLAQGLPLYYNPDTLDSGTLTQALQDRRQIT
jgi:recombination protein RecR